VDVVLPAIALAALVALLVLQPLRSRSSAAEPDRRGDLEAAKESKYREIKDAELDYRMGKLSEADWRALDAELRAQAIEILRKLDRLEPSNEQRTTSN
jgi:hypothetical protein